MLGFDLRTESRAIKAEVGYMTQRFSLYEDLSIEENLNLVAGLYRLPDPRGDGRATRSPRSGSPPAGASSPARSPGGWKQRLALAACIMHAAAAPAARRADGRRRSQGAPRVLGRDPPRSPATA